MSGAGAQPDADTGQIDVCGLIEPLADTVITVAFPATPVLLPAAAARALGSATLAAIDNVRKHAGNGARGWVLVEDDHVAVRVSVRDDCQGFAADRLDLAAGSGRLGVSQSITGRLREIGGTATVTSSPRLGTEVDLRVPR